MNNIVEIPMGTDRALAIARCEISAPPGLRWKAWDRLRRERREREKDARPCDSEPPEAA